MKARLIDHQGARGRKGRGWVIEVEFEAGDHRGDVPLRVKGGRWLGADTATRWTYPLSVETCRSMRKEWGQHLQVEKSLSAWYRAEVGERQAQAHRATVKVAKTPRLAKLMPELNDFIGPDQKADAVWMTSLYEEAGILAHEPGLGKTYSVVAGLVERQPTGPILIVCPKVSVRTVWAKHLEGVEWPVHAARGTRATRERALAKFLEDPAETKILIVVAEMLRAKGNRNRANKRFQCTGFEFPELFGVPWAGVILDESHRMLGALTITKGNLMSEGLRRLPYAPDAFRLAVSGTPFGDGGKLEGMFGTLHWCWPKTFTSFWNWANDTFEVTDERVYIPGGRGATKTVKKIGGLRKGTEEQFFKDLGARVLRRTLEEVSPAHEGLRSYEEVLCDMEGEQLRQYMAFSLNAEVTVQGGVITAVGSLAEMTRARQIANGVLCKVGDDVRYTGTSGKLDMVMQRLEEMGLLGKQAPFVRRRKVVIASQWNEYLKALCERLDKAHTTYHLMTGSTTDNQRDAMMDQFQSDADGPHLFIMNAKAGGVSITLDAADFLFQLDEMFPPEANEQLHRRIFRRSRVHAARVVYFRSEGTIDENVAGAVGQTLAQQLRVLDARRGLEITREVIRYRG